MLKLVIPIPSTLFEISWTLISFAISRELFKKLDQDIKNSDWYKYLKKYEQWLIAKGLDVFHHFYLGLLLMLAHSYYHLLSIEWFWIGVGIVVADIPDLVRYIKDFTYLYEKLKKLVK